MLEELDPPWEGVVVWAEHWHLHHRLYERYGAVLAYGDFSGLKRDLKDGTAVFVTDVSLGRQVHAFKLKSTGQRVYIVTRGQRLCTAWPVKEFKRFRARQRREAVARLVEGGGEGA